MARRRARRRYVRRAGAYTRGRASVPGIKGMVKPITAGLITGAIQSFIPNDALGGYGDTLVPLAVGWFMNDRTLQTIGGYQLGVKIASNMGGSVNASGVNSQV